MKAKQKAKLSARKKRSSGKVRKSAAKTPSTVRRTTADISSIVENKRNQKDLTDAEKTLVEMGISPMFDPMAASAQREATPKKFGAPETKETINAVNLSDMRAFATSPVPRGTQLQCTILRNKKGLNKLFPTFELYCERNNEFLMAAKKRSNNRTSNYIVTTDQKDVSKDSTHYVGKLRSNFSGTEFVVYNKGMNPSKIDGKNTSFNNARKELGVIRYEQNVMGARTSPDDCFLTRSHRRDRTCVSATE
jgi:hypothetical protein